MYRSDVAASLSESHQGQEPQFSLSFCTGQGLGVMPAAGRITAEQHLVLWFFTLSLC